MESVYPVRTARTSRSALSKTYVRNVSMDFWVKSVRVRVTIHVYDVTKQLVSVQSVKTIHSVCIVIKNVANTVYNYPISTQPAGNIMEPVQPVVCQDLLDQPVLKVSDVLEALVTSKENIKNKNGIFGRIDTNLN